MRVLVDENSAVQQVMAPLKHLLRGHQVDHVEDIGWKGKLDVPLFRDARQRGYEALITIDRQQLQSPEECRAIKNSQMHHIRYEQRRPGLPGLALAIGAVIAAMPGVMAHLEQARGQQLIRIISLDHAYSRFEATDPATDPPAYWPGQGRGRAPRRR